MVQRILIADDDTELLTASSRTLGKEYEVETARSGEAALQAMEGITFDLVLLDLAMPGLNGLDVLRRMAELGSRTPAIMISGSATVDVAVQAIKSGAIDFLEKPLHAERLLLTVRNALRYAQLHEAHQGLQGHLAAGSAMVGDGPAMQRLKRLIARAAPSDGRVLIVGENGTGKELVAAALHAGSGRRLGPFVKLNCGAVPNELIESELFGHERGAFTGANSTRRGRFELADGGTLFLDEIGDMPAAMQVKLLRVLQEGTLERLGGSRSIRVDVRVVAATNRDLTALVASHAFREDLYYRLNVLTLRVPPLRDRTEDVPQLVRHFCAPGGKGRGLRFTERALAALRRYEYPGNVRELQNLIERFAILHGDEIIDQAHVDEVLSAGRAGPRRVTNVYRSGATMKSILHDVERQILAEAIEAHGGNKLAACAALGMERSFFYKKCREHGLAKSGPRRGEGAVDADDDDRPVLP